MSQRRSIKSRKATMRKRTFTAPRRQSVRSAYAAFPSNVSGTNPQSMLVHRGIGFLDKFRTRLQITDNIVLAGFGVSVTTFKQFSMNSCYDPDPSLGGGQPTYFDQFQAIYQRYNVVGSKLTARFALPNNTGITGDGPYQIGCTGSQSTGIPTTDPATLCTQPNTTFDLLTGDTTKVLTTTFSMNFLNENGASDSATSANPALQWYGGVWASPLGASIAGSVNVIVTIEYIVDFFILKSVIDL